MTIERKAERHLDQDLAGIRQDLLRMGGRVEEMIGGVLRTIAQSSHESADSVIRADAAVDQLEKQIDEECIEIMARHQPAASDLRFLTATMKIANDLERVGDSAKNIARSLKSVDGLIDDTMRERLSRLGRLAEEMLGQSLDAFVRRDSRMASDVWQRDDEVDEIHAQIYEDLLSHMMASPLRVRRGLDLVMVARNFERIGDHATNIAEDVIFYVEGLDIRHAATRYE